MVHHMYKEYTASSHGGTSETTQVLAYEKIICTGIISRSFYAVAPRYERVAKILLPLHVVFSCDLFNPTTQAQPDLSYPCSQQCLQIRSEGGAFTTNTGVYTYLAHPTCSTFTCLQEEPTRVTATAFVVTISKYRLLRSGVI